MDGGVYCCISNLIFRQSLIIDHPGVYERMVCVPGKVQQQQVIMLFAFECPQYTYTYVMMIVSLQSVDNRHYTERERETQATATKTPGHTAYKHSITYGVSQPLGFYNTKWLLTPSLLSHLL